MNIFANHMVILCVSMYTKSEQEGGDAHERTDHH